jgi:hypothetical protein
MKKRKHKKDKLLIIFLIFTVPGILLWFLATLSFVYINFIAPFIVGLNDLQEVLLFVGFPLAGLFAGIAYYQKNKNKWVKFLVITNLVLLIFTATASLVL